MSLERQIEIYPVTRIEGHGKVTLHLNDAGQVNDAWFQVTQFRGFEKIAEGRPFAEMPSLTARTCGICPVSHLLASAKACDGLLAVEIPAAAVTLRKVVNLAQILQSHALAFFYLASPDLLLGMDSDPASRNIFGVLEKHPEIARDGIALRKFGQEIIAWLAGKRIHPAWIVPGGVNKALERDVRDRILAQIPDAKAAVLRSLESYKIAVAAMADEIDGFGTFPSLFMGMVGPNGELEHYDGLLRVIDASGQVIADGLDPRNYQDFLEERIEPFSFLKSPFYKPLGYPEGMYRTGPLARLNVIASCGTPLADRELADFPGRGTGPQLGSFHYHHARLIEILYCLERIEELLAGDDVLSPRVRAVAGPNRLEAVGCTEAPRGLLWHHYKIDEAGLITWANMIIATGNNNLALNKGVLSTAQHFVKGERIEEGMLNRVEAVVRAYDPCLSCSTHAVGQMPLKIELRSSDNRLLDEAVRD